MGPIGVMVEQLSHGHGVVGLLALFNAEYSTTIGSGIVGLGRIGGSHTCAPIEASIDELAISADPIRVIALS